MRMSDWISDVCSSDRCAGAGEGEGDAVEVDDDVTRGGAGLDPAGLAGGWRAGDDVQHAASRPWLGVRLLLGTELHQRLRVRDRKSAVSGKSAAVRVDLGGRRTCKQKNISPVNT